MQHKFPLNSRKIVETVQKRFGARVRHLWALIQIRVRDEGVVRQPFAIRTVGNRQLGNLAGLAGGFAEQLRRDARLFEVLERLQQRIAKALGLANGSEIAVGGDFISGDLVTKKFKAESGSLVRFRQKVFQDAESQIDVTVGQHSGQRPLKMKAQQARGDDDRQRSQHATRLLPCRNLVRQGCLQHRLKRTHVDFAWR